MGLFSKKTCCLCDAKAGMLTRQKIADGLFICGDCLEKCSSNMDSDKYRKMSKEDVLAHMEYVKENNEKYEKEFKETASISNNGEPIISIDEEHGWWVLANSDPDIFTFDQIKDYEFDLNTNYLSEDERKIKKSFLMEVLSYSENRHNLKKCPKDSEIKGMYINVDLDGHPWIDSVYISIMDVLITTPSDIQNGYDCADELYDFLENPKKNML